ncbi:MAG: sel1 repeat family protein [Lachnospiraceae bacterium]|nr:sel1 repeat family protein [Lachnospiraceae bacterium]
MNILIKEPMTNLSPQQRQEAEQLFSRALQSVKRNDYFRAAELYGKAAAYGHSGAQNNLGILYKSGRGINKDLKKAFELFSESAQHGDTVAMRNLSTCYMDGSGTESDFNVAVEWLETAADRGDNLACAMLAKAYDNWKHKDEEKKVYWHKRAAELGNSDSMFFLGSYLKKAGETQNLSLAKNYLEQAASFGTPEMKLKVAQAYDVPLRGDEQALDLDRARSWYTEVTYCDNEHLRLEAAKGLDEKNDYSGNIRREALDISKAYATYRALANSGNREACLLSGYCCEVGKGNISQNINIAIMLYEKANDKQRADWCRKKKSGNMSDENFESHKRYDMPDMEVNIHTHGKELYSHDFDCKESAYNGRIYYIGNVYSDKSYIVSTDFTGKDLKIICEISDDFRYGYIHVNSFGIFLYYTKDGDILQILHIDLNGSKVGEYTELCDGSYEDGYNLGNIYFYDNICYFVYSHQTDGVNKAEIKRIEVDKGEDSEIIYNKANAIDRLFATDKMVIFKADYYGPDQENTASGWMLLDLESRQVSSLSNPYCSPETILEHPEKYDCDNNDCYDENTTFHANIVCFDMGRKILWTEREAKEGEDSAHLKSVFYWEPHWIGDDLDNIIKDYPVWKIPSHNYGRFYFDGSHYYFAEDYYTFKSSDKYGNVSVWSTNNGGHGVCDGFRIIGDYLFLDVAAYYEEQYNLTVAVSEPIRKSWFNNDIPGEVVENFEMKSNNKTFEEDSRESSEDPLIDILKEENELGSDKPNTDRDNKNINLDRSFLQEEVTDRDLTLQLSAFRAYAKKFEGVRDKLIAYRKSLPEKWDYNAFVGILMSVKGPKHGDAACMNMAIGQGDNFKSTEKRLEEKGLIDIFNKYKGKKYDESVLVSQVENEIMSVAPEYRDIMEYFNAVVVEPMSRGVMNGALAGIFKAAESEKNEAFETDLYTEKKIGETDVKYNICTFGSKFHIGFGISVVLIINGRQYNCKTHNTVKGRMDGMKKLYDDNGIILGDVLRAEYSAADRSIRITKL